MKIRFYLFAVIALALIINVQAKTNVATKKGNGINLLQPPAGGMQRTPEERAKRETEWMKTDLALTDKQIPLVDTINLKYAKKQAELRKQMEGQDREAFRPKMEELQKQKSEELKSVLTEDQMKKYIELLPQRRGRGQGGPRPEGARPQGN
jgi:hypothetical protein